MKTKHQITLTPEQIGEVLAPIISVVMSMDSGRAQYWIGHKKKLAREARKILVGADGEDDVLQDWHSFYHSLGIKCDLSGVQIPDDPGGFDRVIIVTPGITPQTALDLCQKNFKCWKWTDKNLNQITTSDRTTKNGPYAIRIRNRVEADEELKNISANQLKEQRIPGITLEERLIYELKYFKETNKHLDLYNWTLCAGSRYGDGRVPSVSWDSCYGGMIVDWDGAGSSPGSLRARQAVSI